MNYKRIENENKINEITKNKFNIQVRLVVHSHGYNVLHYQIEPTRLTTNNCLLGMQCIKVIVIMHWCVSYVHFVRELRKYIYSTVSQHKL